MDLNETNTERVKLVAQFRELHDKISAEGRTPTGDEQAKLDTIWADSQRMKAAIDREVQLAEVEKEMSARKTASVRADIDPGTPEGQRATPDYRKGFVAMLKNGGEVPQQFQATLQKAVPSQGGYLVPIEFETKILEKLYNANLMRQLGTVTRTTSQVNIPLEGALPTFGWIDELGTYPATDLTVAPSILSAWKLGGIITVSEELLDDAFMDVGDYIAKKSALAAGFSEESAFFGGDGNKKPTGVLTTIAASGVTQTSAVSGKVTSADMFTLKYGLPRAYRRNASFVVADSLASALAQEKSTTGQYLWLTSLIAGTPDVYLGKPIYTSDFLAPLSGGSISALWGDFSFYNIVDRVGWAMQKLDQLYAANGMVGYRMHERVDGKLLRPEAIQALATKP